MVVLRSRLSQLLDFSDQFRIRRKQPICIRTELRYGQTEGRYSVAGGPRVVGCMILIGMKVPAQLPPSTVFGLSTEEKPLRLDDDAIVVRQAARLQCHENNGSDE